MRIAADLSSRPHLPSDPTLLTFEVPWDCYDASRTDLTWPSRYLSLRLPGREGATELLSSSKSSRKI